MIRLTQLAVAKRSVTVLITLGLLLAGVFSWSSAQAGAAARHPVPVRRRHHADARRQRPGRLDAGDRAGRAIASAACRAWSTSTRARSTACRSSSPRSPTARTSRTRWRRSNTNVKALGLPSDFDHPVVRHQRLPVADSRHQGTGIDHAGSAERAGRHEHRAGAPEPRRRQQGRSERRHAVPPRGQARSGQAGRQRRLDHPDPGRARGQQPDPAGRLAADHRADGTTISIPVSAQHQLVLANKDELLSWPWA